MSQGAYQQGQRDANGGNGPRDVQRDHWKARQDYLAGYDAEKKKRS